MAIYISWKNTIVNTPERFISNMFGYLSSRWYPTNVIKSEPYTLFNAYAQELSSSSVELTNVYRDLDLLQVRTTAIQQRTQSKMYDNFGSNIGIGKLFEQNHDGFSTSSLLQSYRMTIRTLLDGFNYANSIEGYNKVGQAFTGVSPLIFDHQRQYLGWRLGMETGSVAETGDGFIISNVDFYWQGRLIPTGSTSLDLGDSFGITYSALGLNTYLGSKDYKHRDIEIHAYASESVGQSFKNNVQSAFNKVIKANQKAIVSYESGYSYFRPAFSTQSLSSELYRNSEFLTNILPTRQYGVPYDTEVVQLPAAYKEYDWYYDWAYTVKNDSSIKFFYRSYPSSLIPEEVYYQERSFQLVDILPYATGSVYAQYLLQDKNTMWDVSGNQINLSYDTTFTTGAVPATFYRGRNSELLGVKVTDLPGLYYKGLVESFLTYGDNFYGEMWLSGINSEAVGTGSVIFKHDNTFIDYAQLSTGYAFGIDFGLQRAFINIKPEIASSASESVSVSIASYLAQSSKLPHYFAFGFTPNSLSIYGDGNLLATSSVNLTFPVAGSYTGIDSFVVNQIGVGCDELGIGAGYLSPDLAKQNFDLTKPRLRSLAIPSSSVEEFHQSRAMIYGSGSTEVELSQFSIRPYKTPMWVISNKRTADILRYPLFRINPSLQYLSDDYESGQGLIYVVSNSMFVQHNGSLIVLNHM